MSRALLAAVAAAAAIAADASAPALRTGQAPFNAAKSVSGQSDRGIDELHGRALQNSPLVTVNAPALGSAADVTGSVSGLPSAPANFKLGILVSPDGTTWWDKTHDYPAGVPNTNPIEGIMLSSTGTFDIMGWVSDPNDKVATYIRVVLVPQSFSFLWPGYQVEGTAWPTNFFNPNTVTAMTTVNRATGAVTNWLPSDGTGLPAVPNGAAPAASPSSAAAPSVAASPAAPSPAAPSPAAPSPAAASPAAASPAASSAAAPAASPSSAAAPSTAAQPSASSAALPNGGDASPSAAPSLSVATPSAAVQSNQTSAAGSSHAAGAAFAGFVAAVVGAVMLA